MKATNTMLALMMMGSLAMAQAPATKKPKAPASQAVAEPASAPAAAPAKAAAKTPAKSAATPKQASKAAAAKVPAKPAETKAAETPAAAPKPAGKRDPFVSPIVAMPGPHGGAVCSTGKRCLAIGEMQLQGIVKTPSGMIAVVENQAKRTYFLHENDAVFNGTVVKITGDSVVFRENTTDNLGKASSREVVKRVTAPTV